MTLISQIFSDVFFRRSRAAHLSASEASESQDFPRRKSFGIFQAREKNLFQKVSSRKKERFFVFLFVSQTNRIFQTIVFINVSNYDRKTKDRILLKKVHFLF